jgi:imidazolonepropionase-like amidohydrolase
LLALTGQGLTPNFGWFTDDPTPRLFAFIAPGYLQMLPEGWESTGAQLEARQKKAEGEMLTALQSQLAKPIPGSTLIRDVRVFDSVGARLMPASDVLIRDGRIVSVTPKAARAANADRTIDGGGRVLIPGLWDMHAHVSRWDGGLNIAAGVTSVRDMGNDNATLQQIIGEEKAGTLLMPRITPAGFIEGESAMSARNGFVIKDLAEAKKAVDWYHEHGYPQIKIYNSFPKAILKDTVAYAHSKGMRVSGHIPAFLRAQDAIDDGYDEVQHINQLMLNFLVDDKTDTRTLERFYLPAKKVADLDFDSKPVQDFIRTMAEKKIASDPTLATFEFLHQRDGTMSPIVAPVAAHLPPDVTRSRMAAEMNIPDDATFQRYDTSFKKMVEFVGRMYKAGVPILAGTDEMPGFTLQHELELYVQAGLTPSQALQVATLNGATVARATDRGVIAPGKTADVVLIAGDPTANIADLRKVALVIKGDAAYYPSEIDAALGIAPFADPVRISR